MRPIFRISCHAAALAASTRPQRSRAGSSRSRIAVATATWMAVGKMSLVLWPRLTWSLGWMGFLGAEAVAAGQLDRPVGDHLVGVHVARGARAGLKDVDGKLVVELAVGHFAASGQQGLDLCESEGGSTGVPALACPSPAEPAQVAVDAGRGPLHQPQGMDQLRRQRPAGNGEVLHGPLRLCAVVRLGGQADLAHRIAFGAELGHRSINCPATRRGMVNE